MQIPILSGIYTDEAPDFRTSYPRNLIPVPKENGISNGYLRPADGIVEFGSGSGIDRGGINWNGICYRVMGTKLVTVGSNGVVTELEEVGGSGQVSMDYSFDRLAIASGGKLFYWNGATLIQVSDPDLGYVADVRWVDGYFMTTDGTSLIVTDLTDPTSVNPLKYGSSEVDPDPILGILKLRDEPHALNRYTVEVFDNVGGSFFPFQRVDGAQIQKGVLGTHCACVFMEAIAFLGSGRNEAPSIYLGANGTTTPLATRKINQVLLKYSEAQLSKVVVEPRVDKSHQLLYVHLPDQTLVYDGVASAVAQEPVWFTLDSGVGPRETYRARNLVWCYDKWLCGDPTSNKIGRLADDVSTHYGQTTGWEFGTVIAYNGGNGAVFHELELVCLTGRVAAGADPVIWTSYSLDGETWSQERPCPAGRKGNRNARIAWLRQGSMRNWRIQKFRGTSDAHLSIARLEATIEALNG